MQVSDDGRGLDRDKILKQARARNLVPDEHLTDADIVELIFQPGFSTAEKVTTVSGRGVGMDVVRKQVQKLRGRVDVDTKPGSGTTFAIQLPLTRAIIDGLVVKVGMLLLCDSAEQRSRNFPSRPDLYIDTSRQG